MPGKDKTVARLILLMIIVMTADSKYVNCILLGKSLYRIIAQSHQDNHKISLLKIFNDEIINEEDKVIYRKKQRCELNQILKGLEPFKDSIEGIAVESTY